MGLGNGASHAQWLYMKAGKFYLSSDKNYETPYEDVTGLLTSLEYKEEEFNGAKNLKLNLTVTSDDGDYKFGINAGSNSYRNVISFLKGADLTKELTFVVMGEELASGKTGTNVLVKQGNQFLKGYYKKDGEHQLPRWEKVLKADGTPLLVNGKELWDKDAFMAALAADVEIFKEIVKANKTEDTPKPAPAVTQTATGTAEAKPVNKTGVNKATVQPATDEEEDSLPF